MSRIVYSPKYNIGLLGLERLHPFDSRKYGRAWSVLKRHWKNRLHEIWVRPKRQANLDELLKVHYFDYLQSLRNSKNVARAIEIPPAARLPNWIVDLSVLRPMRWATRGTIVAAEQCLEHGFAVNLGGGYHHAKPSVGEGFCVYSDIAIAIEALKTNRLLTPESRVAYIDLDAHQGNGVCHSFMNDRSIFIFDAYNSLIYPNDEPARRRIDCDIQLVSGCDDLDYARAYHDRLPPFLDSISNQKTIELAVYNAGTDVFKGDPLGQMDISANAILERDLFVVKELRRRQIPTVMVLSGGYTKISFELVANSVIQIIERLS